MSLGKRMVFFAANLCSSTHLLIFVLFSSLFPCKSIIFVAQSYYRFALMRHTAIIIVLMVVFAQLLSAQIPLSSVNNLMRAGDVLYKVEVDYMDAGEAGIDQVWYLGQIGEGRKDVVQGIVAKGDTVTIMEKGHLCHYILRGDTLFEKGEQQRRSYRLYDTMRPLVRYPFQYGDSIAGRYRGEGREENLEVSVQGWGYTIADGAGILTDGYDTLHHVTRLRMSDDCIETYDNGQEIRVRRERYLWYCAGYRYPVMESVKWTDAAGVPTDSVTYLFLPVQQYSLGADMANDSLLTVLDMAEVIKDVGKNSIRELASIQVGLSSDGMTLTVDYALDGDTDIAFIAGDIVGNILANIRHESKGIGEWQECITLNRKPIGNVVMLNVQCQGQKMSMKVFKE